MYVHLLTIEGVEQWGEEDWRLAPLVPLRHLGEQAQGMMMPMSGDEVELRLPDGQTMTARIASFGLDAWMGADGKLRTNIDPSDPMLGLSITGGAEIGALPAGTEVWFNARFEPEATETE